MIDFTTVKVKSKTLIAQLKKHPDLKFKPYTTANGNIILKANFYNLSFEIYEKSGIVKIKGSFHYLFNGGKHNYNDFRRLDIYDTICTFCELFKIPLRKAILHSLEFGVNVIVNCEPSFLIESVLCYKFGRITPLSPNAEEKDAIMIDFEQYKIKIYSKSKQFDLDKYTLRFEVKITRMAKINHLASIKTLNDLLNPSILQKLGNILLKEFQELIILEPMQLDKMTLREKATFEKINNRSFWESISDKSKRRDYKKRFSDLTNKFGNGLKKELYEQILTKINYLLEDTSINQTSHLLTSKLYNNVTHAHTIMC